MTRTTPLRRITLQFRHIFFTDAATFMLFSNVLADRLSLFTKTGADHGTASKTQLALKLAFFSSDSYC